MRDINGITHIYMIENLEKSRLEIEEYLRLGSWSEDKIG